MFRGRRDGRERPDALPGVRSIPGGSPQRGRDERAITMAEMDLHVCYGTFGTAERHPCAKAHLGDESVQGPTGRGNLHVAVAGEPSAAHGISQAPPHLWWQLGLR